MPAIEDANAISIALDKKVKFSAIVVSPDLKGDYSGKTKVINRLILNSINRFLLSANGDFQKFCYWISMGL
jgi:hypothetical protein